MSQTNLPRSKRNPKIWGRRPTSSPPAKAFPHLVDLISDADRCPDTYRRMFALTPAGHLVLADFR